MARGIVDGAAQDLKYAWRGLLKQPGFSALAILTLALGGGEVTMEELARLYAMLPNRGLLKPVLWEKDSGDTRTAPLKLLSEEAAYVTLDMLTRSLPIRVRRSLPWWTTVEAR